jgi:putative ABC transport system permease protein
MRRAQGAAEPHGGSAAGGERASRVLSVLLPSLRDLQWRARRFLLAAVATGLVLGVALMISGIANTFPTEITRTLGALGADTWLVRQGSPGPFTDPSPFPLSTVSQVRGEPGDASAAPVLVSHALESVRPGTPIAARRVVNLLGVAPHRLGSPAVAEGRPLGGPGEAVVDDAQHLSLGSNVALNGQRFTVVGIVHGVTYFAGQPVVFIDISSAQRLQGSAIATAVLLRGHHASPLAGFRALDDAQVRTDLSRPTAQAQQTMTLLEAMLWLVGAAIIAAIVYLSAMERRTDFAVMKAVGTPSSSVFVGLLIQAAAIALAAAAVSVGVEAAIAPTSPLAVDVTGADYAAVPVIAILVGFAVSAVPARRAARVDPALAFGSGR